MLKRTVIFCLAIFVIIISCDKRKTPGQQVGEKVDEAIAQGEKLAKKAADAAKRQAEELEKKMKKKARDYAEQKSEELKEKAIKKADELQEQAKDKALDFAEDAKDEFSDQAEQVIKELKKKWKDTKKDIIDNWDGFDKEARKKWPELTDRDLRYAPRNLDYFVDKLSRKYKKPKDEIRKELEEVLEAAKENKVDLETMNEMSQKTFLSFLNREKIVASNKLAIDLQKNILATIKTKHKDVKDSGVREGPFWVLVGAQMPAAIIEIGYITNPQEAKRINSLKYQKLLAKGIADGIDRYFYHNEIIIQ